MLTFMLGVLGSLIFWAIYIPTSFVVAITIAKNNWIEIFNMSDLISISHPKDCCDYELDRAIAGLVITLFAWPFIFFVCAMAGILRLLGRSSLYLLSFCVRSMEPKVPRVKITLNKE